MLEKFLYLIIFICAIILVFIKITNNLLLDSTFVSILVGVSLLAALILIFIPSKKK